MPRHRYKTDFTEDYARFRARFDKDYSERAQKEEPSSMWRKPEPDYEMHAKPYKPDKAEKPSRDVEAELEKWDREYPDFQAHVEKRERIREETPSEPEKVEPAPEPVEPMSIAEQQKMYKELLEPTESTPVEDLELEIKPADYLEKPVEAPVEKPLDYAEPRESDVEPNQMAASELPEPKFDPLATEIRRVQSQAALASVVSVGVEEVSLKQLKELAKEILPTDSNLRMLILSEPDMLPIAEAMAKMDVYLKLLHKEFKS